LHNARVEYIYSAKLLEGYVAKYSQLFTLNSFKLKLIYLENFGTGRARVTVLNNVSLDVWRGEFLVVLGPSGSGKSTLLSIIGGIERPTSGRVIVNGVDLTQLSDGELTKFR